MKPSSQGHSMASSLRETCISPYCDGNPRNGKRCRCNQRIWVAHHQDPRSVSSHRAHPRQSSKRKLLPTQRRRSRPGRKSEVKRKHDDVIDDIFEMGSKKKKTVVGGEGSAGMVQAPVSTTPHVKPDHIRTDKGLVDVLGAIKQVPKGAALKEGRKYKKNRP